MGIESLIMLSSDAVLQNRYRIVRPLGRGGMGAVYEALDTRLSRRVALKETFAETDELRRAFEREARLLANLRHPTLPKVLDHFAEGDGLFLVMEYIHGDDLGAALESRGGPFPASDVLRWADQLLGALSYLHGLDPPVLHRDIKPQNLKLAPDGHVVLLDFGLAKGSAGEMTRAASASLAGYSPNYSPLEQMQGTGTDERSDLYSLAATLYHLLTGVRPPNAISRASAVVNGQPDPLRPAHEVNEEVAPNVSAALMRAMALNVENRPRTASEMRDELHNMMLRDARTVPVSAQDEVTKVSTRPGPAAGASTRGGATDRGAGGQVVVRIPEETWVAEEEQRGAKGARARRGLVAAVLALMLVTALAAVYLLFFSNRTTRQTQTNRQAPLNRAARPTPSPTPAENINQPRETDETHAVSAEESAARARLAQRRIPYDEVAFRRAVEEGETDVVELFLAAGMSPDVKDSSGRTLLVNAASRGSNNISQKLLSKGADVNASDDTGATALMEAARGGHRETAEVLLEKGADVNLADNEGRTALIRAAAKGDTDIVRMLINKGASVDAKDKDGRDALAWAEINDHSDVIKLLRKAGAGSQ